MDNFEVTVETTISKQQVQDLLCNALEGGSNYWYWIDHTVYPEGENSADYEFWHLDVPFEEGGHLVFKDIEDQEGPTLGTLNLESIKRGLQVMADKFSKHFHDFITENDDAITGDVFLQCGLFGDVIYA